MYEDMDLTFSFINTYTNNISTQLYGFNKNPLKKVPHSKTANWNKILLQVISIHLPNERVTKGRLKSTQ